MPEVHEQRTAGGETREWTGSRWEPVNAAPSTVDNPRSFGLLDYLPGLRDVLNIPENLVKGARAVPDVVHGLVEHPADTMKGFVSGASEAATPGRLGLAALLTGGATLPAALGAAGAEAGAEAGRVSTGAPNAATSFPEAAGRVAEAASVPGVAAAAGAVPGLVRKVPGALGSLVQRAGHGTTGAIIGGIDGYRRNGVMGAIEEGALGAVGGRLTSRLGRVLEALDTSGGAAAASSAPAAAAEEAAAASEPAAASRPSAASTPPSEPESAPPPASSSPSALSPEDRASLAKRYPKMSLDKLTFDQDGKLARQLDGLQNAGPTSTASAPSGLSEFQRLDSEGTFGGDRTTGQFKEGPSGLNKIGGLDQLLEKLGGRAPSSPPLPDFTFEPGDADIPGLSVGDTGATPASTSPDFRTLSRGDENWGPGTLTRAGDPAQAMSSKANLIYDPQTPTDYLRSQLSDATEPGDREFLARALDQRYRIERATAGLSQP